MKLSQVLFSQGFGPRRECEGLIVSGHVTLDGVEIGRASCRERVCLAV